MINKTDRSALIGTDQQAHLKGDLKHFLKPFFTFRLYVKFKKDKRVCHFYGNEHACTYKQLQHGQVPSITMDKIKGYTGLITLVEKTWASKIMAATIYMRLPGETEFNGVCRRWYNGEWEDIQDPVISDAENITTLYYHFKNRRLQILSEDPAAINYQTEITNALNTKTDSTSNPTNS